jgi:hypothetical protein
VPEFDGFLCLRSPSWNAIIRAGNTNSSPTVCVLIENHVSRLARECGASLFLLPSSPQRAILLAVDKYQVSTLFSLRVRNRFTGWWTGFFISGFPLKLTL